MSGKTESTGAVALASGGVLTSFALAACCAIPIALVGLGLSAGWLIPIVSATQPYAKILTPLAALALVGSVLLVLRASRACAPGDLCARPWFRRGVMGFALIGAILLVLSKIYA